MPVRYLAPTAYLQWEPPPSPPQSWGTLCPLRLWALTPRPGGKEPGVPDLPTGWLASLGSFSEGLCLPSPRALRYLRALGRRSKPQTPPRPKSPRPRILGRRSGLKEGRGMRQQSPPPPGHSGPAGAQGSPIAPSGGHSASEGAGRKGRTPDRRRLPSEPHTSLPRPQTPPQGPSSSSEARYSFPCGAALSATCPGPLSVVKARVPVVGAAQDARPSRGIPFRPRSLRVSPRALLPLPRALPLGPDSLAPGARRGEVLPSRLPASGDPGVNPQGRWWPVPSHGPGPRGAERAQPPGPRGSEPRTAACGPRGPSGAGKRRPKDARAPGRFRTQAPQNVGGGAPGGTGGTRPPSDTEETGVSPKGLNEAGCASHPRGGGPAPAPCNCLRVPGAGNPPPSAGPDLGGGSGPSAGLRDRGSRQGSHRRPEPDLGILARSPSARTGSPELRWPGARQRLGPVQSPEPGVPTRTGIWEPPLAAPLLRKQVPGGGRERPGVTPGGGSTVGGLHTGNDPAVRWDPSTLALGGAVGRAGARGAQRARRAHGHGRARAPPRQEGAPGARRVGPPGPQEARPLSSSPGAAGNRLPGIGRLRGRKGSIREVPARPAGSGRGTVLPFPPGRSRVPKAPGLWEGAGEP